MSTQTTGGERNWLLYDGECPFCSAYVRLVRLRKNAGTLELHNARDRGPEHSEAVSQGFDLDEGMLLKMAGRYYHGKDCIHALALLGQDSDLFGRLNGWIFRSEKRSALLYPVLRAGRNLALLMLGRRQLSES